MRPDRAVNESSRTDPGPVEELLVRFDRAWKSGSAPRIEDFLPADLGSDTIDCELVAELVMIDLEYRWRQAAQDPGRWLPPPLEDYAARFPQLGTPDPELIAEEYRARHFWGDRPGHDEYLRRFPDQSDQVKEALARVDAELAAEPEERPPPSRDHSDKETVSGFLDAVRRYGILDSQRLNALIIDDLQQQFADARSLGRELLQRGWLTAFQVNHLLQGKGAELHLGAYLLIDRLGDGGKGQVFKAWHQRMARLAAVKVIRSELLADPEAVRRFYKEIEAASRLSHPNVVHAFDAGPCGSTHFLAMEYVEGVDLNRLVKEQGPLAVPQACDCIRQTALGLQYIHEHGLVHRDIKPANLLIADCGLRIADSPIQSAIRNPQSAIVKILDLGLARVPRLADGEATSILTQEGAVMGTPDYMAPEQANDPHAVDIRADLYSLGCTFHYLLTGQAPFPGGTLFQKADRHRWEEPPGLERLRPETPATIAAVVRKLLAKRPDDRFQTPAEVADLLADIESVELSTLLVTNIAKLPSAVAVGPADTMVASQPPVPTRNRRRILGIGALLLVLLPIFWLFGARPSPQPIASRNSIPDSKPIIDDRPPLFRLSADDIPASERFPWQSKELLARLVAVLGEHRWRHWGPIRCVAVSPDGRWVMSSGDDRSIRLWDPKNGRELCVLDHPGPVQAMTLAPDGSTLASACVRDNGIIRIWDLSTQGPPRKLVPAKPAHYVLSLSFAPDGKRLVSGGTDKCVRLWDISSGKEELPSFPDFLGPVQAAFSPDGRTLAIADQQPKESKGITGVVEFWDVAMRRRLARFPDHFSGISALAFSPNSRRLASGCRDSNLRLWDFPARKALGPCRGNQDILSLAFAPDSKTIVSGGNDKTIRVWDVASRSQLPRSLVTLGPVNAITFMPDGQTVVAGGDDCTVRLLNATNCKERTPPRGHVGAVRAVVFTPDGRKLISTGDDQTIKVWDLADPRREPMSLHRHAGPITSLALAPNGRTLASASWDSTVRLWNLADGSDQVVLGEHAGRVCVAFAPNGQLLATGDTNGIRWWDAKDPMRPLHTLSKDDVTGPKYRQTDGRQLVTGLAFSTDGRVLASLDTSRSVRLWEAATAKPIAGPRPVTDSFALSPDGKTLAFSQAIFTPNGPLDQVKLWDLDQQKEVAQLSRHRGRITGLTFAPDGQTLVAAYDSGAIQWQTPAGELKGTWQFPGPVYALAFSPDGLHLATANANGTIYILRLLGGGTGKSRDRQGEGS